MEENQPYLVPLLLQRLQADLALQQLVHHGLLLQLRALALLPQLRQLSLGDLILQQGTGAGDTAQSSSSLKHPSHLEVQQLAEQWLALLLTDFYTIFWCAVLNAGSTTMPRRKWMKNKQLRTSALEATSVDPSWTLYLLLQVFGPVVALLQCGLQLAGVLLVLFLHGAQPLVHVCLALLQGFQAAVQGGVLLLCTGTIQQSISLYWAAFYKIP